ncbi:hypothetical protein T4B_6620 [Trichinella pseudospiralis]|uniref:Uncharacterized protein n=1 Tax=Trichinella pseudospiralis TaxID=6337 RepID=A0A0V1IGW6_TRIPS|nr:hypothetical protein T4B_6620 [Trichinella pseudospiralis]
MSSYPWLAFHLSDFAVTVTPRSKRTSERNCILDPFEYAQKLEILLMLNSQLNIVEHYDTLRRVLTKSIFCFGDFSQIVYILTEFFIDHLCRQGEFNSALPLFILHCGIG